MRIHKPQPAHNQNQSDAPFFKPVHQLQKKNEENNATQAKLQVERPNDIHEKEEDQVADQVANPANQTDIEGKAISNSKNTVEQAPTITRLDRVGHTENKPQAPTPESIQRANTSIGGDNPYFSNSKVPKVESTLSSSKGKGSKMEPNIRNEMETGFGRDLSNVNIHTGSDAVQMNQELCAKAFTNGNDIYFNRGEYNPSSKEGKHLLAHELTHTVQQGGNNKIVQRAETDTKTAPKDLVDSAKDINDHVNKIINEARKLGDANLMFTHIYNNLGAPGSFGRSVIEDWVTNKLDRSKQHLPNVENTKYAGVKENVNAFSGGVWLQEAFPILNPSIKVGGILIGSDKLGHFFQQGLEYYQKATAAGGSLESAKSYGKGTEEGNYGLLTTGIYSNADLSANLSGYEFWTALVNNPSLKFDIKKYVTKSWNEEFNPNFYADTVAPSVWRNLINGASVGHITYPSLESDKVKGVADFSMVDEKVVGSISYSVPDKKGVFKLRINGTLKYIKDSEIKGSVNAVSKVKITFNWKLDNGKSGTGVLWSYKEQKLSGTLKLDKAGTKVDYRKIAVDL